MAALVAVVASLVAVRAATHARSERALEARVQSAREPAQAASVAHAVRLVDAREGSAAHFLHEDARHTHRARAIGPDTAKLLWKSDVGGPVEAQVVASNDERTLYVASLDGGLSALDVVTGARKWRVALGARAYMTPCVAADGTIYAGSDAKRFVAVHPDGSLAWSLETDGEVDTAASPTRDGLVVFAAGLHLYAVRPSGDLAFRFDAKNKIFTSPAVADDGTLVFGSQDDHVYALDARGALLWSVDLGSDVDGAPAIADDGTIAVGDDAGEIVRIDPHGAILGRTQVGGFVRGPLSIARDGDILAGVYGPTPRLVRLGSDGTVRASFPVHGTGAREFGVQGGPLEDARGALYFGAQDDEVHALLPLPVSTNDPVAASSASFAFRTGGDIDAPLTLLSSGALVAASDDGSVYLFAR